MTTDYYLPVEKSWHCLADVGFNGTDSALRGASGGFVAVKETKQVGSERIEVFAAQGHGTADGLIKTTLMLLGKLGTSWLDSQASDWRYVCPSGSHQGPFSLETLKAWRGHETIQQIMLQNCASGMWIRFSHLMQVHDHVLQCMKDMRPTLLNNVSDSVLPGNGNNNEQGSGLERSVKRETATEQQENCTTGEVNQVQRAHQHHPMQPSISLGTPPQSLHPVPVTVQQSGVEGAMSWERQVAQKSYSGTPIGAVPQPAALTIMPPVMHDRTPSRSTSTKPTVSTTIVSEERLPVPEIRATHQPHIMASAAPAEAVYRTAMATSSPMPIPVPQNSSFPVSYPTPMLQHDTVPVPYSMHQGDAAIDPNYRAKSVLPQQEISMPPVHVSNPSPILRPDRSPSLTREQPPPPTTPTGQVRVQLPEMHPPVPSAPGHAIPQGGHASVVSTASDEVPVLLPPSLSGYLPIPVPVVDPMSLPSMADFKQRPTRTATSPVLQNEVSLAAFALSTPPQHTSVPPPTNLQVVSPSLQTIASLPPQTSFVHSPGLHPSVGTAVPPIPSNALGQSSSLPPHPVVSGERVPVPQQAASVTTLQGSESFSAPLPVPVPSSASALRVVTTQSAGLLPPPQTASHAASSPTVRSSSHVIRNGSLPTTQARRSPPRSRHSPPRQNRSGATGYGPRNGGYGIPRRPTMPFGDGGRGRGFGRGPRGGRGRSVRVNGGRGFGRGGSLSNANRPRREPELNPLVRDLVAQLSRLTTVTRDDEIWKGFMDRTQSCLTDGFSGVIEYVFQASYGSLWTHVIRIRPPWKEGDVLYLLEQHRTAVFYKVMSFEVAEFVEQLGFLISNARKDPASPENALRVVSLSRDLFTKFVFEPLKDTPALDLGVGAQDPVTYETASWKFKTAAESMKALFEECLTATRSLLGQRNSSVQETVPSQLRMDHIGRGTLPERGRPGRGYSSRSSMAASSEVGAMTWPSAPTTPPPSVTYTAATTSDGIDEVPASDVDVSWVRSALQNVKGNPSSAYELLCFIRTMVDALAGWAARMSIDIRNDSKKTAGLEHVNDRIYKLLSALCWVGQEAERKTIQDASLKALLTAMKDFVTVARTDAFKYCRKLQRPEERFIREFGNKILAGNAEPFSQIIQSFDVQYKTLSSLAPK